MDTALASKGITQPLGRGEARPTALQDLFSKFEPISPAGRVIPMEGMRGFAAMLVFLVHFRALFGHYAEGTVLFSPFQILGALGHTGVDLFFILSGYLIYGIVMDRRFVFWRFFVRRIRRLYPTFLVVFAIYLAASFVLPSRSKLPSSLREAAVYNDQFHHLTIGILRQHYLVVFGKKTPK